MELAALEKSVADGAPQVEYNVLGCGAACAGRG